MIPLVLHVLPYDLARGAQVYARALRDALDGEAVRHRVVTLFRGEPGILAPDYALRVSRRPLRRFGYDPRAALRLGELIRRVRPRVIVTHGAEPLKYAVGVRGRVPLVHYRIGISAVRSGPRLKLLKLQHRVPDVMAGVSNETLDEAVELFGVERSRCVLIANGRDPEKYRPGDGKRPRPNLLFLGHFAPTKRPEIFVSVVERLRGSADFDATMIGGGDGLEPLRARAEAAGIQLLGRREDVPALLRDASVFLFTSIPEGEGMPGVFIEAGMAGLPTVATAVPGARTVIAEGETGFVVEPEDLDGMTERVGRLLRDAELRESMGRAARQRCVAEFTLEQSFARWSEVLGRWL